MIHKIAFIGGRDLQTLGGIENYMLNLSQNLVARGYQTIVYCESDHYECLQVNGVKIVKWRSFHSNLLDKPLLGLLSTLHALLIERHVDLFHYNAWPPSLWSWIPRCFQKKTLMQGHGLEWKRSKYSFKQQKILKFMERVTAYLNQNLTMVSQAQSDYFKQEYGRSCVTIPPGVSLPMKLSNDLIFSILNKYGLHREKYFLYLGRLVPEKNPDVLIRAFQSLKNSKYKLVIAGNNPANPAFVNNLKRLAINQSNIVFTDAVFGEEKFALISQAFAYCIPSTLEGLPISLLECMSYARFCIASDIPGCREALGNEGVFVSLSQLERDFSIAMNEAIVHSKDLSRIGLQNQKRVMECFSWDFVSKKYIEYINDL